MWRKTLVKAKYRVINEEGYIKEDSGGKLMFFRNKINI